MTHAPTVRLMWPNTPGVAQAQETLSIFSARRCRTVKDHDALALEVASRSSDYRANFLNTVVFEDWAIDVLEFIHLAWDIENIPVWMIIELLRHRLVWRDFSMEQLSQRAIDPRKLKFIGPNDDLNLITYDYINQITDYSEEHKIASEDLREYFPVGIQVNCVIGADARTWHHFFYMRCSEEVGGKGGAHPMFVAMADTMLAQARNIHPIAFKEILPS